MQLQHWLQTYCNRRLLITLVLGFASGLPLALVGGTLQAWYTISGIDILAIGSLSLIGQPYVYKFFWAPLFDRYSLPFLGRRRGWMLVTQIALLISIAAMAFVSPKLHPWGMAMLALWVAFLSASQDIGIDAYRTDILQTQERGLGAAMAVGGYRIAMWVSGGLALIMADYVGWQTTYLAMASLMLVGIAATIWGPALEPAAHIPQSLKQAFVEPMREFFSRDLAWVLIIFIVLFKLGEAFTTTTSPVTTAFLLRGLEFSLSTVGFANKLLGVTASIIGVFLGGLLLMRYRIYNCLLGFGLLQVFANLTFVALAIIGKSFTAMLVAVCVDNFSAGMGMAAITAFIMDLCDRRFTASQFALFSALAVSTRVFTGPIAGEMISHMSWVAFYIWSSILALPAVFLLWGLRRRFNWKQFQTIEK